MEKGPGGEQPPKYEKVRKQTKMAGLPAPEIIERYEQGESTRRIAKAYDTSENMIRRLLDKHGVSRRRSWALGERHNQGRSHKALEELPADRIATEYQAGASMAELAKTYRVGLKKIGDVLDSRGVQRRSSTEVPWKGRSRVLTAEQEAEVVAQYRQGQSQKAIARNLDVSHPTVRTVLQRHGIDPSERPVTRTARRALTDEQVTEARALYAQGIGSTTIAQRLGVSSPTVLKSIPESERRTRQRKTGNQ